MLGAITGFLRGSEGLCGHGAPTRHAQKNAPTLEAPGQSAFPEGLFRSRERQPKNCGGLLLVPLLRPHRERFARGVAEMPPRRRRHTLMTGCPTDGTAHENIFKLWR